MNKTLRFFVGLSIMVILSSLVGFTFYNEFTSNREASEKPLPGAVSPNFQLETLDGEDVELKSLKEKVVLVNFWATWCGPCLEEMPAIQSTYDQYKDNGFEVLAVNIGETEEAITTFKKKVGVDFPILKDTDKAVMDLYDVYYLPASFLINQDGEIVETIEGKLDDETLDKWVKNQF